MTCAHCEHELQIGEWPWCPHDLIEGFALIDDELEGGPRFFDTLGDDEVWIESKSQWRREVAARELVHVDRHDAAYYARWRREHEERVKDSEPLQ